MNVKSKYICVAVFVGLCFSNLSYATSDSNTKKDSLELSDSVIVKVPNHYRIRLIGENIDGFKEFSNFTLTISRDYLNNKIKLTPKSFEEAVLLLNDWLDESDLNKIISTSKNDFAFVSLFDDSLDLGFYLEKMWQLKSDNKLSITLQKYGIYSTLPERTFEGGNPSWIVEALFRGIYEFRTTGEINTSKILSRVGSYAILNTYDGILPPTTVPTHCKYSKVYSADIVFQSRSLMLSDRIIRWVNCEDGEKYVYLWEQGWLKPTSEILNQINEG